MINRIVKQQTSEEKTGSEIERIEREQLKYMKALARANRLDQVILRGCSLGIFTALGTTIGFAIVLAILASFVSGIKDVPFLNNILESTKLDVLIETQIANLSGGTKQPDNGGEQPQNEKPKEYKDDAVGFKIIYPNFLNYVVSDKAGAQDTYYHFAVEGSGVLNSFEIYVNEVPKVDTANADEKKYDATVLGNKVQFNSYFEGLTIDDVKYNQAIFTYELDFEGNKLTLIGIADEKTPRIAREIFKEIIESFEKI